MHSTTIILPRLKLNNLDFVFQDLCKVTNSNPFAYKNAVLKIATYFRREFNYDFIQFHSSDDEVYEAYLFSNYDREFDYKNLTYGACCFRWREWTNHPPD